MFAVYLCVRVILTLNSYHFPSQHQPDILSSGNAVFSEKYETCSGQSGTDTGFTVMSMNIIPAMLHKKKVK